MAALTNAAESGLVALAVRASGASSSRKRNLIKRRQDCGQCGQTLTAEDDEALVKAAIHHSAEKHKVLPVSEEAEVALGARDERHWMQIGLARDVRNASNERTDGVRTDRLWIYSQPNDTVPVA